ncbi:MAG: dephospho-CoA kinase [Gammaproteobacteria bacterium]
MKDTLKIGLTGGIASGKSTVCDLFSQLSVEIIDADKISHDITKKDGLAFQEILDYFGKKILGLDGELDRQQLRSIIFNDATAKRALENIIHPKVLNEINKNISDSTAPYLIIAVPLMIETGMNKLMDRVLLIDCSIETQIRRLIERDKCTKQQAQSIIENQASLESKRAICDDVIVNEEGTSFDLLKTEVIKLNDFYSTL